MKTCILCWCNSFNLAYSDFWIFLILLVVCFFFFCSCVENCVKWKEFLKRIFLKIISFVAILALLFLNKYKNCFKWIKIFHWYVYIYIFSFFNRAGRMFRDNGKCRLGIMENGKSSFYLFIRIFYPSRFLSPVNKQKVAFRK